MAGILNKSGSTSPDSYWALDRPVGQKFMPVINLNSPNGAGSPVLHDWTIYGMVVPIRQDEWMLPIQLYTRVGDLSPGAGQPHYQDTLADYLQLKAMEASGQPVNVTIGALSSVCYIDQIQVSGEESTKWNDARTFPETTVIVKLITLGPIGQSPTSAAGPGI